MSATREALALAEAGRGGEALRLLEAADDDDARLIIALWRVEGRHCPRDLGAARDGLRVIAGRHRGAARVLAALLAPVEWSAALAILNDWRDRDDLAGRQLALIAAMDDAVPEPQAVSEAPFIARLPGLFSRDECELLVALAGPRLKPARIFHEAQGRFVVDPLRTSDAAGFPAVLEAPFVHALNRRIARATVTDVAQGEPLQVLRYAPGQEYRPHIDAIPGVANQRVVTVIAWLNDGYDGGATRFEATGYEARGGIGDALMFRNVLPDGAADPASRHAGLPVARGVKLLASRWIRAAPADEAGFGAHEAAN